MQHNFWARVRETDPSPTWQAVCDHMITDYIVGVWPRIKQVCVSSLQLIGTQAMTMNPRGTAQSLMGYTAEFGSLAGEGLPPHDAAVLSLYTDYPGRRTHGRMYISGIAESIQTDGILSASAKTSLKNLGDWLTGQFGTLGTSPYYWWGVYSRANGAVRHLGPPPYISYGNEYLIPWSRHVVNEVIGTQRHRKIGRGA
jgi:hypothetical protein